MKKIYPILVFIYCFVTASYAQEFRDSLIVAKIDVVQSENTLTFRPTVQNNGSYHYELDYLLLIKKTDANKNLSVNQQKGKFTLKPNQIESLSSTTINQTSKQKITAILFIRDEVENRLITKDSVQFITKELIPIKETALIGVQGIVVDDSKTKIGRDYYDFFYAAYTQYPTKFDFIINISELPYRGLSSIVQVKVDQDLIIEFFTNPDEEYLKEQVAATFKRLVAYSNNRGKLKNEFTY
ncbi:curli production assembly/transport protein CsgE [Flavobacterium sp. CBA20B-1]|uniref:curli production assembly/transport protein CsgE n=1 Tax=unclassified Flavobacterium TaxID=196869 RepID=UPI0022252BD9|nr:MULTISPECIES: curli production assembly/transport protein CsgE [unclassified Flavobacterium]WCM43346.1 curli production assembly/transport protein CsgE [Flavobacterium sp. CBA20B-1]